MARLSVLASLLLLILAIAFGAPAHADLFSREEIADRIEPPFILGDELQEGVYELRGLDQVLSGYAIQTEAVAPLPGFSGAPVNILLVLDREGVILDSELLDHNEPIFVSGLGEAPFQEFVAQYRGLSIADRFIIDSSRGGSKDQSGTQFLDGVAKATASVRIANESLLAAGLAIAREKMQGLASEPSAYPNMDYEEDLDWADLVEQGIAHRLIVTNAEVDAAFADTIWADDDDEPDADRDAPYLDLWLVDLGPPSVAKAVLDARGMEDLEEFRSISAHEELILLIDAGRHGLVREDFIRNTTPELLQATQDGLPVALRDSDLFASLRPDVPEGTEMIIRIDRRLGFDPIRPWTLEIITERFHGSFQPKPGQVRFGMETAAPERFFTRPVVEKPLPPWQAAINDRMVDLIAMALFLAMLIVLVSRQSWFASRKHYKAYRYGILAITIGFVGWHAQAQLSLVTVTGIMRALMENQSLAFLLYDPVSLLIWGVVLASFLVWGRGFFCGWLCPFGAMQEMLHGLGRLLRLPEWEPSPAVDRILLQLKFLLLAVTIGAAFFAPSVSVTVDEIEPFKTAVTTHFVREWYYVLYAAFWLIGGMVLFKSFCRYICPLGALMVLGGLLRRREWIPRREECGSPCQLCKVRCKYNAIEKSGAIRYDNCFQCLDCVTIHDDAKTCVPLILAARKRERS